MPKEHYGPKKSSGRKQAELDRLWQKQIQLDREIATEARQCAKNGSRTARHVNLCADMVKLKNEYEKLKGGGAYNPHNADHTDQVTIRKFLGDRTGKTGPDTHTTLED